jgi:hypothetical protein
VENYVEANNAKNKAARLEKSARKELLEQMVEEGLKSSTVQATVDGKIGTYDVKVGAPDVMTIDMEKLKSLVSKEAYLQMISTTKAAIEKFAGTAVSSQVVSYEPNKDKSKINVSVKISK